MAKLRDEAKAYEPKQIKNIADLDVVSVDLEVYEDLEAEFPYKYLLKDEERYKLPVSVLEQLKGFLAERPNMTKFKVKKTGIGMNTKYQVIPID